MQDVVKEIWRGGSELSYHPQPPLSGEKTAKEERARKKKNSSQARRASDNFGTLRIEGRGGVCA